MLRSKAKKNAARYQFVNDQKLEKDLTGSIRILSIPLLNSNSLNESFQFLIVDVI